MYEFEPKSQQHVQHANVNVIEKISNPNEHDVSAHEEKKPFKCEICNYSCSKQD